MIIVLRQSSQISNRLVSLAPLMGFCLRNKVKLLVFSLNDYRQVFQAGARVRSVTLCLLPPFLWRLLRRVFSNRMFRASLALLPFTHLLDQQRCWSNIEVSSLKQGLWIIDGAGDWCPSMPSVSAQDAIIIKQILSYHSRFYQHASAYHDELRKGCDILIGVHARRGDYQIHRNGCWYYSESDYLRWIDQAAAVLREASDQRIHFVVCSNELGFLEDVSRADVSVSNLGSGSADQFLLSMCDLIIGPPSTFSVWAAFLSDTRLLHIFARDQVLAESQIRRSTLFYGWQPRLEVSSCT